MPRFLVITIRHNDETVSMVKPQKYMNPPTFVIVIITLPTTISDAIISESRNKVTRKMQIRAKQIFLDNSFVKISIVKNSEYWIS